MPDGGGGYFLITNDRSWGLSNPFVEGLDVRLIHLAGDLAVLPIGDRYLAADPCGVAIAGGRGDQIAAGAAAIAPGAVLVVGIDAGFAGDEDRPRVFLHAVDGGGAGLFADAPVHPAAKDSATGYPLATLDPAGGFFLAWHRSPDGAPYAGTLLVQRFDASGVPVWTSPAIVADGSSLSAHDSRLAADGQGGAWLVWRERNEEAADPGFTHRIQRIDERGTPVLAAPGSTLLPGGGEAADAEIAPGGKQDLLVVFSRDGLRGQLYDAALDRQWSEEGMLISDPVLVGVPRLPSIASAAGGPIVTWIETGNGEALLARRLRADGTSPWPRPVTLRSGRGFVGERHGILLADGSLAVAWEDLGDPAAPSIRAGAVDARGRLRGPPGGAVPGPGPAAQRAPRLVPVPGLNGAGGDPPLPPPPRMIAVWSDARLGSLAGGHSDALFLQALEFFSSPRLEPSGILALTQGDAADLEIPGDDLHPGAAVEAGPGIAVDVREVEAVRPDGPGDLLRLHVRASPAAALGPRSLRLTNPDGGAALAPGILRIELDPRRIDLDRSGRIDGFDLALLARSFGRRGSDPLYSSGADIDGSGLVDGADLALLASRFGRPPEGAGAASTGDP